MRPGRRECFAIPTGGQGLAVRRKGKTGDVLQLRLERDRLGGSGLGVSGATGHAVSTDRRGASWRRHAHAHGTGDADRALMVDGQVARGAPVLAARGSKRDWLLPRPGRPAVEGLAPREDLPQAGWPQALSSSGALVASPGSAAAAFCVCPTTNHGTTPEVG